jgi:D-alanyl-lipoteichoic acid acyltransferase DltB (MBOAT superfamily)
MIFHSLHFIVFLVVVLAIYWVAPARWRNFLLVPASLVFYGFVHPWFLLPFAATTIIDYFVARGIEAQPARKHLLVGVSVVSNLGLLGVFKYYNFFVENAAALLVALHLPVSLPVLSVVLPAGISFYTFQSIGYVVDVSRGQVRACRSFRDYALFVSFFPQLVAGPIQRAGHLLAQIQSPRTVRAAVVSDALVLMAWGFFKKLVIADNVAITANKVFAMQNPSFAMLWTGVLAFCIQIFADFSAYTDIARGTARLFGFDLSPNFNHPYLADSPSDFWRRWHISLSTWIRDYIFIPLGGSRQGSARTTINLVIVFLLTGIWHGASWNFALWGLYYAVLTIIYRAAAAIVPQRLQSLPGLRLAKILLMFVLTNLGWLIFREQNVHQLWRDLTLSPVATPASDWRVAAYLSTLTALFALPLILHALWDTMLRERVQHWSGWPRLAWTATTAVSLGLFLGILFLRSDTSQDFIYFQF